jgi:hypothetical protein
MPFVQWQVSHVMVAGVVEVASTRTATSFYCVAGSAETLLLIGTVAE